MDTVELVTAEEVAKAIGLPATDSAVMLSATAANELLTTYLTPDVDHSKHAKDKLAALTVAVDIFQARTASGGQVVGLEFQPTPFRMGASLLNTVSGLLGPCLDQTGEYG